MSFDAGNIVSYNGFFSAQTVKDSEQYYVSNHNEFRDYNNAFIDLIISRQLEPANYIAEFNHALTL